MNRISSIEWEIVKKKDFEDELYYKFSDLKQIYEEYNDESNLKHLLLRFKIRKILKKELTDLKDDLSNFQTSFLRFKKKSERNSSTKKNEITEWLSQPNQEDDFSDFIKKWVESLMIHGASAIYKESLGKKIDNFFILPGGTVYPLRGMHVSSYVAYAQVVVGHFPKIYFQDEMIFTNYLPSAIRSYGYIPLDALINKISEQLLFDQFAAERADGTKEPEKLIVFGDTRSPFGDLTGDINLPINPDEQKRIEEKLNTARKGAIATMSGIGTPAITDISKADTFGQQAQRQDKLLRDIALVFNLTNMEINLAGGEFTSGKETSESQSEIDEGKGTRPIIQKIEGIINNEILPYRFGTEYIFQFKKGLTDYEQVKLDTIKSQSGTYTKNEIRIQRGDDPIFEKGNDSLIQQEGQQSGQSPFNPINVKNIE